MKFENISLGTNGKGCIAQGHTHTFLILEGSYGVDLYRRPNEAKPGDDKHLMSFERMGDAQLYACDLNQSDLNAYFGNTVSV